MQLALTEVPDDTENLPTIETPPGFIIAPPVFGWRKISNNLLSSRYVFSIK